jgi:putative membrane protein
LAFRGTVLPQVLTRVGILTAFCLVLCLLNDFLVRENGTTLVKLDQLGHSVLGMALSLLIVFRTQSSYTRFWEARTLWGSLTNSSRSVVRLGSVYASPADDLARLVAAYVLAIKQNLRDDNDLSSLRPFLSGWQFDQLKAVRNPPTALARAMSEWVRLRLKEGKIDTIAAMEMDRVISEMVTAQGGCERIHLTPLPFVYAGLIKQLLLVYLATLPFVLIGTLHFAAPVAIAVVSFAMLGIEDAGVEIEDPFGRGPNHLPLDQICENIAKDTAQLAQPNKA